MVPERLQLWPCGVECGMLRAILLLALALLMASPAEAVELPRPRLDVIGFSPDGRFFAYRQSGLDIGNVHFADLFIVDTLTDKWVEGSPVRVRRPASQSSLQDVRNALDTQAGRLMRRLGLSRALAGVAYVPRDRARMYLDLPWGERALLSITTRLGLAAPGCPLSVPVEKGRLAGFLLTLQRPTEVSVVHDDSVVPRGRGCPISYRFASGFIKPRGNDAVIANVIAYREPTYGGHVRTRYMAITSIVQSPGDRRR